MACPVLFFGPIQIGRCRWDVIKNLSVMELSLSLGMQSLLHLSNLSKKNGLIKHMSLFAVEADCSLCQSTVTVEIIPSIINHSHRAAVTSSKCSHCFWWHILIYIPAINNVWGKNRIRAKNIRQHVMWKSNVLNLFNISHVHSFIIVHH